MSSVESRSSIFLCVSSTTVYASYPWLGPAATYGGSAGPVVHVAPSQTRPKAVLQGPVSKCRRGRAWVTLRITKLAVRNELRAPPHAFWNSPVDKSGSFHSLPSQNQLRMRDTSSERSAQRRPAEARS